MGIFSQKAANRASDKGSPEYAVSRYNIARFDLLLAILFTVVNIVLGELGGGSYFLFSISFPYYSFDLEDLVMAAFAVIVLVFYFLAWLFSKKKTGWMVAALIAFALDCAYLGFFSVYVVKNLGEYISYTDFIMDYIIHAWVLISLIVGVCYARRYKAAITATESAEEVIPIDANEDLTGEAEEVTEEAEEPVKE